MKIIYAVVFTIILHFNLNAQNTISLNRPSITPVSSGASAMEKYVSYPVDHSTGIPNINIPLYQIKVGDLVLPISISYHSAGLKPKEPSGRVATGWTLNAEPSIMRNIVGTADDATIPWQHTGYIHSDYRPTLSGTWEEQEREKARLLIDKEWDGESDRYVYNLNQTGGTCYIGSTYGSRINLLSHPLNDDIITASKGSIINDFKIINPKGITYSFGNFYNSKEKCDNDITRWLCDTISSAQTNAKITFDYTIMNELNPATYYGMNQTLIVEDSIGVESSYQNKTMLTVRTHSYNSNYQILSNTQKVSVSNLNDYLPSYDIKEGSLKVSQLNAINFGLNKVSFYYNQDVLNLIVIKDAGGQIFRSIEFYTSKYNLSTELTKLDSIKISAPGCESQIYSFQYYNEQAVPSCSTTSLDHWGFANNRDHDAYLDGRLITVPTIKTKTYFHVSGQVTLGYHKIDGANREPDSSWTRVGVLRQITNPEGIQTVFQYSLNKGGFLMYYRGSNYEKYNKYLYPVGGLKVDRIATINPKANTYTYKDFKYGLRQRYDKGLEDAIWGGGAIKHIVTDRDYCTQNIQTIGDAYGGVIKKSRIRAWSSMPISSITFNNGSPVLYNAVIESTGSFQDTDVFKTAYQYEVDYHPYDDVLQWDSYNSPNPKIAEFDYNYNPRNWAGVRQNIIRPYDPTDTYFDSDQKYGHLNKVEYFRHDTLVSVKNYKYVNKYLARAPLVYRPYRLESFIPNGHDINKEKNKKDKDQYSRMSNGHNYWPSGIDSWKVLSGETVTDYHYNNGIREQMSYSKTYHYKYSINPDTVSIESSDNKLTKHSYKYLDGYSDILSYHKQAVAESSQEREIEFTGGARPHKVKSKTHLSNEFEDEMIYEEYDSYGNIAHIVGRDGIHTCYIWGYNNQYVLAQIVNITYEELLVALQKDRIWIKELGNLIEPTEVYLHLLNGLRDKLKASQITTYTYKPLRGVASICDPALRTTYFNHDYYGRLTESYRMENGQKIILNQYGYNFSAKDGNTSESNGKLIGVKILNSLGSSFIYLVGKYEQWVAGIEGGSGYYKAEWKIGTVTNNVFTVTDSREYTYAERKVLRSDAYLLVPALPQNSTGRIYCKITDLVTGIVKEDLGYFYSLPN